MIRANWAIACAAAAAISLIVSGSTAEAQSGETDPSFGSFGRLLTDVRAGSDDRVFGVAIQPDGKIVIAGSSTAPGGPSSINFAVARYNPDGSPDTSFGTGGVTLTDIRDSTDTAHAVAIQADGKIVAAGSTNAPNGDPNLAVIRYNSDGNVDPTFGDNSLGPGRVVTDVSQRSADEAFAILIQPDGKIIVAGETTAPGQPSFDLNVVMVRYTANGIPEIPFGDNVYPGRVLTTYPNGANDRALAIALQSDGKILLAGETNHPVANNDFNFMVLRYGANGVVDPSFGVGGGSVIDLRQHSSEGATSIGIQPGGKIVVSGTSNAPNGDDNFAIVRFNLDGLVDGTFGDSTISPGIAFTDFSERSTDKAKAMTILPSGQIVVAGSSTAPRLPTQDSNFALVRYTVDGVPETNFGPNNRVLTNIGNTSNNNDSEDEATAVTFQADGKIVAAGDSNAPVVDFNFSVARYLP